MLHDAPCHHCAITRVRKAGRPAMAVVGFVVMLLVMGSFALWLSHLTGATSRSSVSHLYSTGAFYGAESGMEMALRELNSSPASDIDSDGTIGTISNNGNSADDPSIATGMFFVEKTSASPPLYRATGRPKVTGSPWTTYRRVIEARLE